MELKDDFEEIDNLKLGRWAYCKGCYKNVLPQLSLDIVVCSECGFGLAPLDAVIEVGRFSAWRAKIEAEYVSHMRAMNDSP